MSPETTKLEKSETIAEIAVAFAKFQAAVATVNKDGENPYFKSKYATLENIIETIRKPLSDNGLSFSQFPTGENGLTTILLHSSGQYLMASYTMKPKDNTPQGIGSAITYMRRYALSAVLGIATEEDDDGNAASATKKEGLKPYTVKRVIPASDDESCGNTERQEFVQQEIDDALKEEIKNILKTVIQKPATKTNVKALTGLEMIPENYKAIIKKLNEIADRSDPLAA